MLPVTQFQSKSFTFEPGVNIPKDVHFKLQLKLQHISVHLCLLARIPSISHTIETWWLHKAAIKHNALNLNRWPQRAARNENQWTSLVCTKKIFKEFWHTTIDMLTKFLLVVWSVSKLCTYSKHCNRQICCVSNHDKPLQPEIEAGLQPKFQAKNFICSRFSKISKSSTPSCADPIRGAENRSLMSIRKSEIKETPALMQSKTTCTIALGFW